MIETSQVQKLLNDQNAEIDRLKNRIEELEATLQHCVNAIRQYEIGDDRPRGPAGDVRPWLLGAMDNARKVLERKDG